MSENRKDLVDDQKRRARRRLVGAAVLALAAAVIVPLFLESEPKPLGQDVQILIPAVEGSKFVNQLSPAAEATGKHATTAVLPAPLAAKSESASAALAALPEKQAEIPKQEAAMNPPPAAKTSAPATALVASPKPVTPQPLKNGSKPEASVAPTVPVKAADSKFVVQLGAYADGKVAGELQLKLKSAGFLAYAERVETSKEKLHRVRVGPYASRDAAETARAQLKAKGHSGIVVPLS